MPIPSLLRPLYVLLVLGVVAGCAQSPELSAPAPTGASEQILRQRANTPLGREPRESIFDLFRNNDDPNTTIEVNRYIWTATQEILNFLPIEAADPFSGVLVYGYGRPPGGSQAYRGTVYVQDPALDARSLNVALATQSGPVSAETTRAIEDAILTRARQLRLADSQL